MRTGDVEFWRGELDNKLSQLKDEICNMTNLKIRVDSEARSCSEPINITQQCITFRQGRQGCDLIRDDVDVSLDRELDQLKMSQVCIQMKDEGCEIKPWSKFRVFWVKPVIRLENKSDY